MVAPVEMAHESKANAVWMVLMAAIVMAANDILSKIKYY
jgi:hypothetical protein